MAESCLFCGIVRKEIPATIVAESEHCVAFRDINPQGLGFVTRHRLPLGYGGILTIPTPSGKPAKVDCTLLRCREAVQGWFEGGMYFNRPQIAFALEHFKRA